MRRPLRVAVIGLGSIGRSVVRQLAAQFGGRVELAAVLLRQRPASDEDMGLPAACARVGRLDALLETQPDLVIECASHEAVRQYGVTVLDSGRDLMIASTGALSDARLHDALLQAATRRDSRLRLVSGAIGAIDVLGALRRGGLDQVRYTGTKPPAAWRGSPAELRVDLSSLETPTTLFSGSAREAAATYPKNANVAATVALAGVGFDLTEVTLVADPGCATNQHRIEARGACGQVGFEIRAAPSGNARSSAIVGDSICHAVGSLVDPMVLQ